VPTLRTRIDITSFTLIEPVPGLKGFLTTLRQQGIEIGLVTSSLKEQTDIVMPEVLKSIGTYPDYESFYEAVIADDEVGEPFLNHNQISTPGWPRRS